MLVVSPGTTETEFFESEIERTSQPKWHETKQVSAATVARQIVRAAFDSAGTRLFPRWYAQLLCWLNRFSPGLVDRALANYV